MAADDDGLLLNFAPASAAPPAKRSQTQRRAQHKQIKRQQHRAPPPATLTATAAPSSNANGTSTSSSTSTNAARPRPTTAASSAPRAAPPSTSTAPPPAGGVISSLFTGSDVRIDPSLRQLSSTTSQRPAAAPTNAPLRGGKTFASLGLHPSLVKHLEGKMAIGSKPTSIQSYSIPTILTSPRRDVLIHSQTGSGKTLAYLLPILHSLLPLCTTASGWIDRRIGTLAIVLAPTRELARQIYDVLERLLTGLHIVENLDEGGAGDDDDDNGAGPGPSSSARWMVPGLLTGGSTRNHEKSRLRKGLPLIVSTPGRLLDHLQNTGSLDVSRLQWLVLDEADRLLDLGFEESLRGILNALEGRWRLGREAAREKMLKRNDGLGASAEADEDDVEDEMGIKWWKEGKRRTILCSATLDEGVTNLVGSALRRPIVVKGETGASTDADEHRVAKEQEAKLQGVVEVVQSEKVKGEEEDEIVIDVPCPTTKQTTMSAPAQLRQHFVVVPTKQRLVLLLALLRRSLSSAAPAADEGASGKTRRRIIVFMSCTDSVDFFWHAMGGARMGGGSGGDEGEQGDSKRNKMAQFSDLLPSVPIYRLHGSLSQADRIASLRGFVDAKATCEASVLFCTSVASRGLDLPSISCVIQLDPPTEGGVEEYLHRVGRTARVGRKGESWLVLLESEREYVKRLEEGMGSSSGSVEERASRQVLREGFGGRGIEYEARATEAQLAFERWLIADEDAEEQVRLAMARRAFLSHLRAYATHPASEKHIFNLAKLQLGHLAKAFALREAPGTIKAKAKEDAKRAADKDSVRRAEEREAKNKKRRRGGNVGDEEEGSSDEEDEDEEEVKRPRTEEEAAEAAALAKVGETLSIPRASKGGSASSSANKGKGKGGQAKKLLTAEERMYAKVREMGKGYKKGGVLGAYGGSAAASEFQIA